MLNLEAELMRLNKSQTRAMVRAAREAGATKREVVICLNCGHEQRYETYIMPDEKQDLIHWMICHECGRPEDVNSITTVE